MRDAGSPDGADLRAYSGGLCPKRFYEFGSVKLVMLLISRQRHFSSRRKAALQRVFRVQRLGLVGLGIGSIRVATH